MLSFPEPPYAWPACTVVWEVELVRVLPTRCSAQHGKLLGGVNPSMSLAAGIISQRQRRHREVGSEGSPRQNLALRYTNRIRPSYLGKPADYGKALWLHG